MSEKRYRHSLCVAKAAAALAARYGGDEKKAYTAGLIHDILKDMPKEALKAYIEIHIKDADEVLLSQPALWHSVAGADYLKNELDADDTDILMAVRYHTSGRAHMSLLEKIVFVADFISEDRDYPGVEEMRTAAMHSLESAIEEGLNFTIRELCEKRKPIYLDTAAAYNDAVMQRLKQEREDTP